MKEEFDLYEETEAEVEDEKITDELTGEFYPGAVTEIHNHLCVVNSIEKLIFKDGLFSMTLKVTPIQRLTR